MTETIGRQPSGDEVVQDAVAPWAFNYDDASFEPDPVNIRRRATIAVVLVLGLIVAGLLVVLAGAALGAAPSGGCGGG